MFNSFWMRGRERLNSGSIQGSLGNYMLALVLPIIGYVFVWFIKTYLHASAGWMFLASCFCMLVPVTIFGLGTAFAARSRSLR